MDIKNKNEVVLKLKLLPQTRLFLDFIKFSNNNIIEFIKREAEENPFLNFELDENKVEKIPYESSVYENILDQLYFSNIEEELMKICEFIIFNLEENGYFKIEIEEVSKILKVEKKKVEEALKIIQSFDPPGIGARNLQECFLIQIERYYKEDTLLKEIVEKEWDLLSKGGIDKISKKLKVKHEIIEKKIKKLKRLNPFPINISQKIKKFIIPDGEIKEENGDLKVYIKDHIIPFIKIEFDYEKNMNSPLISIKEKKILEKKIKRVKLIIEMLEKRRKFLEEIFTDIVNYQKDFFKTGILHPLKEKDIAEKKNVSVSTISRAVNNKYLISSYGLIKIRDLFSSEFKHSISRKFIEQKIREIIEGESKSLSDREIAEKFGYIGIKISPRTINKYRNRLKILNSYQRKRQKYYKFSTFF
ncbi:MAG: RNA polymerase factor sigma-54 [bacterium]|nr:RNA polymerase factor sigma-54 [bacterium]